MTKLNDLEARANRAQETYEVGRAALYRGDGSPLFSDTEHREREEALRSERLQRLTEIEAAAKAERAAAVQERSHLENADPLAVLSDDELQRAEPRRSFVADEVWGLDEEGLLARLRSVRASGDRAAMFLYWQTARSHQSMRDDAMGRRNRIPTELSKELDTTYDELAGPDRQRRMEAVKAREAKAEELLLLAGSLKAGGRNPAQAYLARKFATNQS